MENDHVTGKLLVALVFLVLIVSGVLFMFGRIPYFGSLPLDILVTLPGTILYLPIGSAVLSGLVLTGMAFVLSHFSKK